MIRLPTVGWLCRNADGGCIPVDRGINALRIRGALALALVLIGVLVEPLIPAWADDISDPRYAGLGGAYTAVVSGPIAGLYNPAGIIDSPGVHGAVGASLSSTWGFIVGASVATGTGPAVAWAGDNKEIQGSFAFYILPRLKLGVGISSYEGSTDNRGLSFALGGQYYAPPAHFGISIWGLGVGIFRGTTPVTGHLSAAFDALPGIIVIGDISIIPTGSEVAIGGEASFGHVSFRWGVAVHISGGFIRAGLGVGGELFGITVDLSGGLNGAEHHPFFSLGVGTNIPAWW